MAKEPKTRVRIMRLAKLGRSRAKTPTGKRVRRGRRAALAVLFGVAAGLLSAELLVRALDIDWKLVESNVYFQMVDLASHAPDDDPILLYRLKPGSRFSYQGLYGPYKVAVNKLGVRGPERSESKPAGAFRIACLGGSNVYGAMLNNDQTWPARLEFELNAQQATSARQPELMFEVLNLGLCAYTGLQMVHYAEEAIRRFDPDLILFALSNTDFRAFLHGLSVKPHFERHPELWLEFYPGSTLSVLLPGMSDRIRVSFIRRLRSLRFALSAWATFAQKSRPWISADHESRNIREVRRFLSNPPTGVKTCVFICPHFDPAYHREYYDGIDVPVFALSAAGKPAEYRDIHPPAPVAAWYGVELAAWLREQQLVPTQNTKADGGAKQASGS